MERSKNFENIFVTYTHNEFLRDKIMNNNHVHGIYYGNKERSVLNKNSNRKNNSIFIYPMAEHKFKLTKQLCELADPFKSWNSIVVILEREQSILRVKYVNVYKIYTETETCCIICGGVTEESTFLFELYPA